MQVTIKAVAPNDTLEVGETVTVELTTFIRGLLRNGLAVQVPRPLPDPVPAKKVPARKAAAKRVRDAERATDRAVESSARAEDALTELSQNAREFVTTTRDLPNVK